MTARKRAFLTTRSQKWFGRKMHTMASWVTRRCDLCAIPDKLDRSKPQTAFNHSIQWEIVVLRLARHLSRQTFPNSICVAPQQAGFARVAAAAIRGKAKYSRTLALAFPSTSSNWKTWSWLCWPAQCLAYLHTSCSGVEGVWIILTLRTKINNSIWTPSSPPYLWQI